MSIKLDHYVTAEEKNDLYNDGYRYYCTGEYKVLNSTDPWSGMPDLDYSTFFFKDRDEAEAFAAKQVYPFNRSLKIDVKELPPHTSTDEERAKRREDEKAAKKQKEYDRTLRKAQAAGVSQENAEAWQKKVRHMKRIMSDIRSNELTIERLQQQNIELNKELEETKTIIAGFENNLESSDTTPNPSLLDYQ